MRVGFEIYARRLTDKTSSHNRSQIDRGIPLCCDLGYGNGIFGILYERSKSI